MITFRSKYLQYGAKVFASCFLVGSLVLFSTYATRLSVLEVSGSFGIDAVCVELESLQAQEGSLLAGSSVPLWYLIRETGADCYLRCKSEYWATGESNAASEVMAGLVSGVWPDAFDYGICPECDGEESSSCSVCCFDPGSWVLAGDGYAYYKPAVSRGQAVPVVVPVQDSSDGQAWGITHKLTVEAVQARHFQPDYSAVSPWGDVRVQDYHGQVVSISQGAGDGLYALTYGGDVEGLAISGDDFFAHVPTMLPGDSCTGTVSVSNEGDQPVHINLSMLGVRDELPSELLDGARLSVGLSDRDDPALLFDGSLKQLVSGESVSLGTISPGQTDDLLFSFSLPSSLDNQVAGAVGEVRFQFEASVDSPDQGADDDGSGDDGAQGGVQDGSAQGDGAQDGGGGTGVDDAAEGGVGSLAGDDGELAEGNSSATTEGASNSVAKGSAASAVKGALAKTGDFLAPVAPGLAFVFAASAVIALLCAFVRLHADDSAGDSRL